MNVRWKGGALTGSDLPLEDSKRGINGAFCCGPILKSSKGRFRGCYAVLLPSSLAACETIGQEKGTRTETFGPETIQWVGGLLHRGVEVAKFISSLKTSWKSNFLAQMSRDILHTWG